MLQKMDVSRFRWIKENKIRCSRKQRELLDYARERNYVSYPKFLHECSVVFHRKIKDVGQLSVGEADRMLKKYQVFSGRGHE